MSNTPMAQPMRALLGAINALSKLGVGPTMESFLAKPYAERIDNKNPGIMTRKVTALVDTEDAQVEGRGGPIHARIYRRPDTAPGAPGYLFIHGGGFAAGDPARLAKPAHLRSRRHLFVQYAPAVVKISAPRAGS